MVILHINVMKAKGQFVWMDDSGLWTLDPDWILNPGPWTYTGNCLKPLVSLRYTPLHSV
jgi:hypothetical protein